MNAEIVAPWTDNQAVTFVGNLGFIYQAKQQLLYFQKQNDSEDLKNDIAGYDEVLNSNNEDNATSFMTFKDKLRRRGATPNNLLIVQAIKDSGRWI